VNEQRQHPVKILRRFLREHPGFKPFSTQPGFAKFVGCSESLIRTVELDKAKVSGKLRQMIKASTGVSGAWLSSDQRPGFPIPAEQGGHVTYELVYDKYEKAVHEREMRDARIIPIQPPIPPVTAAQKLARSTAKLVEDAILESLKRGDTRLINDINMCLLQERPPEAPGDETLEPAP
jgi:hypothetical protein